MYYMKVAKEAIKFYCLMTGNSWSDFYSKLDSAMLSTDTKGELNLVRRLMNIIEKNGISVNQLKQNKDAVKAEFDEDARKNAGEFFTPEVWCTEARKYFDAYIPNWQSEYNVWDGSCGSGNLMRTAGHPADKLFLSSLQQDDIDLIRNTPEYAGATAFQCDFLKDLDYDSVNTDFLNKLPERLQQIIRNDEPLIIYMNPPYKSGSPKNTDVGTHMCQIGLNKPAYDIFYQFMWRVMHFVEMFNLSNTYVGVFGPLQFFTGASANILLQQYEKCFEFLDGMCLSAQEFSDTSDSIKWGIGFSLWKSRGGYINDDFRKDVLLDKKYRTLDGSIHSVGKVLYEPPKEKLSTWVQAKDVSYFEDAPLMTSHLTFKDSKLNEKVAKRSGSIAVNALGTLMVGNTLTRSSDQSAILSMPSTISYTSITEENFWRCVASYAFRRVYDASWAITKKEISAPNEKAEGYDIWLRNALVLFLFEYKSMMSSIRGVSWGGYSSYSVTNKLFFLSADEVREHCTDPVILEDIENNPTDNSFMLRMIEESKPYWCKEAKALFDFCKEYTLFTLDKRRQQDGEYPCSLDSWDAGFQQIRSGIWHDSTQEQFAELLMALRDYLRKGIDRFGFVTDADALDGDTPEGVAVDAGGNIIRDDTSDDIDDFDVDDSDADEDGWEDESDYNEGSDIDGEDDDFAEFDESNDSSEGEFNDFEDDAESSSGGESAKGGLNLNFTDIFAAGSVVDTKTQVDSGKTLNIPTAEPENSATEIFDIPAPPTPPIP